MKKRMFFFSLLLLAIQFGFSQETEVDTIKTHEKSSKFIDFKKTTTFIDTLLIDRDPNHWSVRLLSSFKEHDFVLSSKGSKFVYEPNNPIGVGIGIATRKLIVDITFNIKGQEENPTDRFDILTSFFIKKHLFDFYFQKYQGFSVENVDTKEIIFRDDIRSVSTGLRYMYMFHESDYSIAAMKTGLFNQEKSSITMGLGGFLLYSNQSADDPIVPVDIHPGIQDESLYTELRGTAIGAQIGVSGLIFLPSNFFLSLNIVPGIGLMNKFVKSEDQDYRPENPVVHQLGLSAMLGYNGDLFYANLAVSNGYYSTDFDFGNEVVFSYLNAKLAIGYKLKGKFKKKF